MTGFENAVRVVLLVRRASSDMTLAAVDFPSPHGNHRTRLRRHGTLLSVSSLPVLLRFVSHSNSFLVLLDESRWKGSSGYLAAGFWDNFWNFNTNIGYLQM
jgi:hypothetical protein